MSKSPALLALETLPPALFAEVVVRTLIQGLPVPAKDREGNLVTHLGRDRKGWKGISARFETKCACCAGRIARGQSAMWHPVTKAVIGMRCYYASPRSALRAGRAALRAPGFDTRGDKMCA